MHGPPPEKRKSPRRLPADASPNRNILSGHSDHIRYPPQRAYIPVSWENAPRRSLHVIAAGLRDDPLAPIALRAGAVEMSADFAAHIEVVARRLLGEPNRALSSRTQWRYGSHGSFAVELDKGTWFDFERNEGGGVLDLIYRKTGLADGAAVEWLASELGIRLDERPEPGPQRPIVATYDYRDEAGALLFQVVRFDPKDFRQRRPDGNGGWIWSTKGVRQVPYRLAALLERPEGAPIFIQEGEKDCDPLAKLGLVATCNAGGAGKWRPELNEHFRGAVVYSLPDNDDPGRDHARQVAKNLHGIASAVRIVQLPGLPLKGDVGDWLAAGGTREQLIELCEAAPLWEPAAEDADPVFVPKPSRISPRAISRRVSGCSEESFADAS